MHCIKVVVTAIHNRLDCDWLSCLEPADQVSNYEVPRASCMSRLPSYLIYLSSFIPARQGTQVNTLGTRQREDHGQVIPRMMDRFLQLQQLPRNATEKVQTTAYQQCWNVDKQELKRTRVPHRRLNIPMSSWSQLRFCEAICLCHHPVTIICWKPACLHELLQQTIFLIPLLPHPCFEDLRVVDGNVLECKSSPVHVH